MTAPLTSLLLGVRCLAGSNSRAGCWAHGALKDEQKNDAVDARLGVYHL